QIGQSITAEPNGMKSSGNEDSALTELQFKILEAVGRQESATTLKVAAAVNITEEKARFHLDELARKHDLVNWFGSMDRDTPDRYTLTHEGRRLLVDRGVFD